jgi:hypothetical protein
MRHAGVFLSRPEGKDGQKIIWIKGNTMKFARSTVAGYIGREIGKYASGPNCIVLGVTTGIGGVVCVATLVGAGAWAGTTYGGEWGEYVGDKIYEISQP